MMIMDKYRQIWQLLRSFRCSRARFWGFSTTLRWVRRLSTLLLCWFLRSRTLGRLWRLATLASFALFLAFYIPCKLGSLLYQSLLHCDHRLAYDGMLNTIWIHEHLSSQVLWSRHESLKTLSCSHRCKLSLLQVCSLWAFLHHRSREHHSSLWHTDIVRPVIWLCLWTTWNVMIWSCLRSSMEDKGMIWCTAFDLFTLIISITAKSWDTQWKTHVLSCALHLFLIATTENWHFISTQVRLFIHTSCNVSI